MIGRLITITAVGAAGIVGTACAAEAPELSTCTAAVTTIAEGEPFPCRPFPPQRMDVLMAGADFDAGVRCGRLGGARIVSWYSDPAGTSRCRTVVVP